MKLIILASTNGSVLNKVLSSGYLLENIDQVISDRQCGAIDIAKKFGIKYKIIECNSGIDFSNQLLSLYPQNDSHIFISFYTRLFKGDFLTTHKNKIINLHPSVLPSFPGMNGFSDNIISGSKFIGSTIHFIDDGIDTGMPIIQSVVPYDPNVSIDKNRHKIFIQQCKMLIQVVCWFEEGRIIIGDDGLIRVINSNYDSSEFSPNLEINFKNMDLN